MAATAAQQQQQQQQQCQYPQRAQQHYQQRRWQEFPEEPLSSPAQERADPALILSDPGAHSLVSRSSSFTESRSLSLTECGAQSPGRAPSPILGLSPLPPSPKTPSASRSLTSSPVRVLPPSPPEQKQQPQKQQQHHHQQKQQQHQQQPQNHHHQQQRQQQQQTQRLLCLPAQLLHGKQWRYQPQQQQQQQHQHQEQQQQHQHQHQEQQQQQQQQQQHQEQQQKQQQQPQQHQQQQEDRAFGLNLPVPPVRCSWPPPHIPTPLSSVGVATPSPWPSSWSSPGSPPLPSPSPRSPPSLSPATPASGWTAEEDSLLMSLIAQYGTAKWTLVSSLMRTKSSKQCRRRWQAGASAAGNKGAWTAEEDSKLIEGQRFYGNRWTEIARLVPGRTDNAAKNRFATLMARIGAESTGHVATASPPPYVPHSPTYSPNSLDWPSKPPSPVKHGRESPEGSTYSGDSFAPSLSPELAPFRLGKRKMISSPTSEHASRSSCQMGAQMPAAMDTWAQSRGECASPQLTSTCTQPGPGAAVCAEDLDAELRLCMQSSTRLRLTAADGNDSFGARGEPIAENNLSLSLGWSGELQPPSFEPLVTANLQLCGAGASQSTLPLDLFGSGCARGSP